MGRGRHSWCHTALNTNQLVPRTIHQHKNAAPHRQRQGITPSRPRTHAALERQVGVVFVAASGDHAEVQHETRDKSGQLAAEPHLRSRGEQATGEGVRAAG